MFKDRWFEIAHYETFLNSWLVVLNSVWARVYLRKFDFSGSFHPPLLLREEKTAERA